MSLTAMGTAALCLKAFATYCHFSGDSDLGGGLLAGEDTASGLMPLFAAIRKKSPEAVAQKHLDALAADVTALMKSDGVRDSEAVLANVGQFGPLIIQHNAPGLIEYIAEGCHGDWTEATAFMLAKVPEGKDFKQFVDDEKVQPSLERRVLEAILDRIHKETFAPITPRAELTGAQMAHISKQAAAANEAVLSVGAQSEVQHQALLAAIAAD
ncbi:MAG: hypothetical protein AAF141_15490, partial [Pseudomonadota bacterium]